MSDTGPTTSIGGDPTVVGTPNNIADRIKKIIPGRWFLWIAPYRDALLGGLADSASWNYSLIAWARLQTRIATATDVWLDIISYDFMGRYLPRRGLPDNQFQPLISATILQERVTRAGMQSAISKLVGVAPTIIEPWNPNDCGGYGTNNSAYGRAGYWGSVALQNQVFIKISRIALGPSGVPNVAGYGSWAGGWSSAATSSSSLTSTTYGSTEYIGSQVNQVGVTDPVIEQIIGAVRPTATLAWIRFGDTPPKLNQLTGFFQPTGG